MREHVLERTERPQPLPRLSDSRIGTARVIATYVQFALPEEPPTENQAVQPLARTQQKGVSSSLRCVALRRDGLLRITCRGAPREDPAVAAEDGADH